MSIKSSLAKVYAFIVKKKINHWSSRPHQTQQKVFKNLLTKGAHTVFGKDHQFDKITTYEEFVNRVPVRDYEGLRSYVDRVVAGEKNILWPGKPLYFAKTSGKRVNNSLVLNNKSSKSIAPALKQRSTYSL